MYSGLPNIQLLLLCSADMTLNSTLYGDGAMFWLSLKETQWLLNSCYDTDKKISNTKN